MLYPQAKSNPAYLKLAELERVGKLRAVDAISQADVLIVGGTCTPPPGSCGITGDTGWPW